MMLDLSSKDITIILISDVKIDESVKAFNHCLNRAIFTKAKFLTSNTSSTLKRLKKPTEIIKISPIKSIKEYSSFMITRLNEFIDTKYALIVQYDGIVVSPNSWTDTFLEYDYIGAPWGDKVVGNGGFCLRSKKLLSTISENINMFNGHYHPEDVMLCRTESKKYFENLGIKYAPYDIAIKFSYESHGRYTNQFGMHNREKTRRILINGR